MKYILLLFSLVCMNSYGLVALDTDVDGVQELLQGLDRLCGVLDR
ncbi:hypothetical protein [Shewanella psychropiezotolerans]|nr:hypothetical protein [Shewanella psychropiezotolerans]